MVVKSPLFGLCLTKSVLFFPPCTAACAYAPKSTKPKQKHKTTPSPPTIPVSPISHPSRPQRLQHRRRIRARLLDQSNNAPKLWNLGVAHDLVQPGLAAGDDGALGPQPGQGQRHLLLVAAADAVREHVDAVARSEEVQRRLRHADVALDPDQRHRDPAAAAAAEEVARRQRSLHRRRPHGEFRLVRVLPDQRARRRQEFLQLRHRRAELGTVLRRRVDGDGEKVGGPDDLLAREDTLWGVLQTKVGFYAPPFCI